MRKKLSKKQIGAMGLAVMMGVQTPAMAAETSQESTTQETVLEPQTEEGETVQVEIAESQAEEIETTQVEITESQTAESQIAEAETGQATTTEYQAEEVNETETQTEETAISTENAESQVEEASEQVGQAEQETEAEVAVLEAAEEDGWHQNDDGSRYYVKDGEVLRGCVEKIGDSYYGFESDGTMYIDSEFTILNEEINRVYYYRAKADGSLYVNEWYIPDEWSKCYYGADGKVYIGVQTVNGKQYYFREAGWLCVDTTVTSEDGRAYACDEEGIATELINNDWTKIDGKRYYVKDGQVLKECIEKIGDFYYGFGWKGAMYADREFSIWNEETRESHYYRAKADGSLYVNEWYVEGSHTYYYGADGTACRGLCTIDGKIYYFNESNWLCKDTIITAEDGTLYYCGEDGAAMEIEDNSWIQVNGKHYYIKNGEILRHCVEKIGDSYYGFDWNGDFYPEGEFYIWDSETGKSTYCKRIYVEI